MMIGQESWESAVQVFAKSLGLDWPEVKLDREGRKVIICDDDEFHHNFKINEQRLMEMKRLFGTVDFSVSVRVERLHGDDCICLEIIIENVTFPQSTV